VSIDRPVATERLHAERLVADVLDAGDGWLGSGDRRRSVPAAGDDRDGGYEREREDVGERDAQPGE
jgi:hypothetical protein